MNPCPCGFHGHPAEPCRCTPDQIQRYQNRLSGPLLDRIDIQIEVNPVAADILSAAADGELTATIAQRVQAAATVQQQRQGKRNRDLSTREIDQLCQLDRAGEHCLRAAMQTFHWSARAYHRVLRVARTIADLKGCARITLPHVKEAIQYRRALRPALPR